MTDYEKTKETILASNDIRELSDGQKPPVPRIEDDQNYVFISYSHRDYKAVYCDLLELHRAGVRYWYDLGLPAGKEWDAVVETKIKSANCAGVIFYLSENLFLSPSVSKEIGYTVGGGDDGSPAKNYFCVNLAGMPPSKILKQIIRKYDDDELEKFGIDDRMIDLLGAFSDKATYINKESDGNEDHISYTLRQLLDQFNIIATHEVFESNEAIHELKMLLEQAKLFSIKDGVLIKYLGDEKEVVIPSEIKHIGERAFANSLSISGVTLPDGMISIEKEAFCGCDSLSEIGLPQSITELGEGVFKDCASLAHIDLPPALGEIRRCTFLGCIALKEAVIPSGVARLGENAFYACLELEKISLPASLKAIDAGAFRRCGSLKDIYYDGTISDWNSVVKAEHWNKRTSVYTVHCTDGDL